MGLGPRGCGSGAESGRVGYVVTGTEPAVDVGTVSGALGTGTEPAGRVLVGSDRSGPCPHSVRNDQASPAAPRCA